MARVKCFPGFLRHGRSPKGERIAPKGSACQGSYGGVRSSCIRYKGDHVRDTKIHICRYMYAHTYMYIYIYIWYLKALRRKHVT